MRILSLGAGVQSTAMLLMSDLGEIDRADHAIFADTGAEPQKVYDWLDFIESKVSIPIIRTNAGNIYHDIITGHRNHLPLFVLNDDGTQGFTKRQCTQEYKILPIKKKTRELLGYEKGERIKDCQQVEMMIGISIDERHRMKNNHEKWIKNRWPLIEKRMSRGDCIKYVEKILGQAPPRSSCLFCPFHNDLEWISVKNGPVDEWQKVLDVEKYLQENGNLKSKPFLHRSMKPIGEVKFYDGSDQLDMFGNECEGMCGV